MKKHSWSDNLPRRLKALAEIAEEEGRRVGFSEFEANLESSTFRTFIHDEYRLEVGMGCLEGLEDTYKVWPGLTRRMIREFVRHEKLGHFGKPLSADVIESKLNAHNIWHWEEKGYLIHERQANLNEICLDDNEDTVMMPKKRVAAKIAVKLWSRAVYAPVSHIEPLIRQGMHKRIEIPRSYIGVLLKTRESIEEEISALSYRGESKEQDDRLIRNTIGEWTKGYLDIAYPWLKDDFGKTVVREVLKIDGEYRKLLKEKNNY